MLGLGLVCGGILAVASKVFYVYEDPRIAQVESFLAGANCGGCGYAGCSAAAVAVVNGEAPPSVCVIAGVESAINVAGVMGLDPGSAEPQRACNECQGGQRAENRYHYSGAHSCRALAAFYGGQRICTIGCLGLGDCIRACNFNAIHMGPNSYPVVDESKCVGCGACRKACPKDIINIRTMAERLLSFNQTDEALAPCAQTCPAEINIPQYIAQIKAGDYAGAVNTIRERNPLLLSCGRVCPHPCEDFCRRGIEDEAVSINQLKRFAADYEMNSGQRLPIPCAPSSGKRVAVIGGGPAGLSCAYFLRRVGHDVTIFDMMPKLGGMIRYGIPEYRSAQKSFAMGNRRDSEPGNRRKKPTSNSGMISPSVLWCHRVMMLFFWESALGKTTVLRIEGEDLEGCYTGIDFLTRFSRHQQGDSSECCFHR